ncbi:MAG: TonB-dependent receptor [Rhodobacteraceae bacterium]|nr:TonB-dependent receptor [Paracoccaceae bacterium]
MKRVFYATATASALGALTAPQLLAQEAFQLDEITVSAGVNVAPIARSGVSVSTLDSADLVQSTTPSLTGALANLPGVSVTQNGPLGSTASVSVRGLSERYLAVRIDGVDATDASSPQVQFNDFGGLTAGMVQRAELLRGAQSALYGGTAIAGVLTLDTLALGRAPEGDRYDVSLEVGSFGTIARNFSMTRRVGATTFGLALNAAQADGFSSAEENVGNTEVDGFERSRAAFGVQHELTNGWLLGGTLFRQISSGAFDEYGSAPQDGTSDETYGYVSTGARLFAEGQAWGWEHALQYSYYGSTRSLVSPTTSGFATPYASAFESKRNSLRYTASRDLTQAVRLSLGADGTRDSVKTTALPGGNAILQQGGVFAELGYSPTEQLDLSVVLRRDHHSSFGGFNTGRLAVAYQLNDQTTLRGMASTGYRPPSSNELFAVYPGFFPTTGNPDLGPETSRGFEFGVDHRYDNGANISLTAFANNTDNAITYQFCPDANNAFCNGGAVSTYANVAGITQRKGYELSGSLPLGAVFSLDGSYTYLFTRTPTRTPLRRTPRHDLNIALSAKLGADTTARLSMQRIANRPDGTTMMPDYDVYGFSLVHRLTDSAEAYLRIENLFDKEYQTISGFGTSDRAFYFGLRASF